ncbi:MAG: hypothetical protein ABIP51_17235 [Bacteroidia bacterium]
MKPNGNNKSKIDIPGKKTSHKDELLKEERIDEEINLTNTHTDDTEDELDEEEEDERLEEK